MSTIRIPEQQVTTPAIEYKVSQRCYDDLSGTAKATLVNVDGSGTTIEVPIPYANASLESAKTAIAVDMNAEVVAEEVITPKEEALPVEPK